MQLDPSEDDEGKQEYALEFKQEGTRVARRKPKKMTLELMTSDKDSMPSAIKAKQCPGNPAVHLSKARAWIEPNTNKRGLQASLDHLLSGLPLCHASPLSPTL